MLEGQEFPPGLDGVGQPDGHRRRPRPILPPLRPALLRFPQGPMGPPPVGLKPTEDPPRPPDPCHLRQGMGLTRPRILPIPPHAIPSFRMHRIGAIHRLSQNRTHRHAHHPARMTALDRLRPPHSRHGRRGRTPPLARRWRVPIGAANRPSIDRPALTDPNHPSWALRARAGLRHPLRRDLVLRRPKAPRHHQTSPPVLAHTSPTRAHPARRGGVLSTILWPVISAAALRLPRRIPTRKARTTSVGGVRKRSIAVPRVGPKERPPFRHTHQGRPLLLSFWIPWVAPPRGHGGFWGLSFRFLRPTSFIF